jgi:sugar lactone lactonase YvrE
MLGPARGDEDIGREGFRESMPQPQVDSSTLRRMAVATPRLDTGLERRDFVRTLGAPWSGMPPRSARMVSWASIRKRREGEAMGEPAEAPILLSGLAIGESPRWHEGRLWLCNWGTREVLAVDLDGNSEVMARVPTTLPFSIDWLPDGRMIVVSGPEALLLRQEPDGTLVTHADLGDLGDGFNEIVVDPHGNAYVNGGIVALVRPDGSAERVAGDISFGNGMAITEDGSTLIVAESWARRLSAFDIAADGGLSNRRVWADLGDSPPDGICLDTEGAVWFADVPNRRCVRVREGGEVLQTVELDRGGFACMLGGLDGRTLFVLAAEWSGMENIDPSARTGQLLVAEAPAPHAGRP